MVDKIYASRGIMEALRDNTPNGRILVDEVGGFYIHTEEELKATSIEVTHEVNIIKE